MCYSFLVKSEFTFYLKGVKGEKPRGRGRTAPILNTPLQTFSVKPATPLLSPVQEMGLRERHPKSPCLLLYFMQASGLLNSFRENAEPHFPQPLSYGFGSTQNREENGTGGSDKGISLL